MRTKTAVSALIIGWLIPGAGHYYLGYRWQGVVFFGLLVFTYLAGMSMAEFRNISSGDPVSLIWYSFAGGITIVSFCATAYLPDGIEVDLYGYQLGCLYTSVASLLNSLVLLQVCSIAKTDADKREHTSAG